MNAWSPVLRIQPQATWWVGPSKIKDSQFSPSVIMLFRFLVQFLDFLPFLEEKKPTPKYTVLQNLEFFLLQINRGKKCDFNIFSWF